MVIIDVNIANTTDRTTDKVTCSVTCASAKACQRCCGALIHHTSLCICTYTACAHRDKVERANALGRFVGEETGADQCAAPQTAHRTRHVRQKPRMVVVADGVADPGTVVIEARDTLVNI